MKLLVRLETMIVCFIFLNYSAPDIVFRNL
jgi:hypothetical protein